MCFTWRNTPLCARRLCLPLGFLLGGLLLGCGGDDATAPRPTTDGSRLYWALTLDHRAITLSSTAPYDTLRLAATPRNAAGQALPVVGAVTFTSSDLATVRVDPDGLLHAVAPGTGVTVIAVLQEGNVTHQDTAVVNVTANPNPPVLSGLSMHPVPPDSAKRAAGIGAFAFYYLWPTRATDENGEPIPDLAMLCTSSDTGVVMVDPTCGGFVLTRRPGHVQLVANATAYGVTKADTLLFTVGQPLQATVWLQSRLGLGEDTVGTGGIVQWQNKTGRAADVTFDDPTNVMEDPGCQCGAGNIPPFGSADPNDMAANVHSRLFPVPGTYRYHSAATGGDGVIVVVDER